MIKKLKIPEFSMIPGSLNDRSNPWRVGKYACGEILVKDIICKLVENTSVYGDITSYCYTILIGQIAFSDYCYQTEVI